MNKKLLSLIIRFWSGTLDLKTIEKDVDEILLLQSAAAQKEKKKHEK